MNTSLSTYMGKTYKLIFLGKKRKEFKMINPHDFNISKYSVGWALSDNDRYYYIVYINRK